jgi:hypothetical protein
MCVDGLTIMAGMILGVRPPKWDELGPLVWSPMRNDPYLEVCEAWHSSASTVKK